MSKTAVSRNIGFNRWADLFRWALGYHLGSYDMFKPMALENVLNQGKDLYQSSLSVSLVTPVRNQVKFIEQTLHSVLAQNFSSLEYIVMDGLSSDGTTDTINSYRDHIQYVESRADDGQSDALNKGFLKTSGDVLGWLNGDDILFPGTLAVVAQFFEEHPEIDVVYGDRIIIDEVGNCIGYWKLPNHSDGILSWMDYVPQETLFWRRRAWNKVGACIDTTFQFAMDWDLLVRFRDSGVRISHIPCFLGAFRFHPAQKTQMEIDNIGKEEMDRIRLRCLGHIPTASEIRRAVAPYIARHMAVTWSARLQRCFSARRSAG